MLFITFACLAGILVGLSRQLNGRLSLSTSPLLASCWNHIIGFGALTILGMVIGGLLPTRATDAPWYAYLGGPIGVVFVAAGSWVVARIGAVNTALLIIGGQMVSGVALDLFRSDAPSLWASSLGVVLIVGGMTIAQHRRTKEAGSQNS
jgi:bacterial/archaeal transporter family-2 protein